MKLTNKNLESATNNEDDAMNFDFTCDQTKR